MKKLLLITGAALALGAAGASSAAALAVPSGNTGTLPGFYVGVGAGYGGMNTPKLNDTDKALSAGNNSEHFRGFAARGFLGYLWALPQVQNFKLGAELGYNYYPKNKYTVGPAGTRDAWNYKGWNVDLLAVGKYNFGDTGFNVIGKIGPTYVRQKLSVTENNIAGGVNNTTGASKSKVKAEGAIGLGYDINRNIDVNVIYAHVFGTTPGHATDANNASTMNKVASVDTVLVNIAYHFGNVGGLV
ncbi:MAG: outer membrane beta-barrel protein [Gammaproteobacteria bacterium]|jgi:opacity protein-like surface antigen